MRSMQFPYEFSVIMAVYNTEAYLREAVDSLIAQTIGFDRIQLILADDGSTDGSGKVCDEYAAKYPGNVVVIHKENGGQASARNEALMHAQGRYVNFLDSDDKLSADAMEKAGAFMRAHENETDICCIPMRFFGTKQGEHPLNYKFAGGNRVIDLMQEQNALFFQMSAASAFYKADAARTMQFDTRHNAEDAKENIRILLNNPHIGIVSDTCYLYRKHGASTLDSVKSKKTWYLPQLKYFSIWALDKAFCRYGYVPAFVQHAVMYDLQWKVQLDRIPTDVLSPAEEKEFESLLFHAPIRPHPPPLTEERISRRRRPRGHGRST